jgi:hypothetical protein
MPRGNQSEASSVSASMTPRRDPSANIGVPSFAGRLDKTSEVVDANKAVELVAPHQTIAQKSAISQQSEASSASASMSTPRRDPMANIAAPSFAGRLDKTSEVVDAKAVKLIVAPHQTIAQKSATSQQSEASSASASMTTPRRDPIANIAVPSFAGQVDKTNEVVDAPHETIAQKSATSRKIDNRGKHASSRVQGPGILEVTTNVRRLSTGRKLQINNRISRRMNCEGTAIERRPGALSVKGRAPGRAPEWIQRRVVNKNKPKRSSSSQGNRTSAIQCEAFAIRQSLVVPGNFHVVRSSDITVKRASRVPTDDQSHLPPEMRTISSRDQSHLPPEMRTVISSHQELRLIEEHESNIPDNEDRSDSMRMRKFRANIVPNRRISKLPTAEVALVNGELVHQLVRESLVISIRDSSNFEADDLSKSGRKCMVSLFRLLGFKEKKKKKKKKHQTDADITIE